MKTERPVRPYRNTKKDASKLIESILKSYEPDNEFQIKQTENPVIAWMGKLKAWKRKEGGKPLDVVASARLIEVNRFGAYRIRKVANTAEFEKAIAESKKGEKFVAKLIEVGVKFRPAESFTEKDKDGLKKLTENAKFREDFDLSDNTNNNSTSNPFDEFTPIMGGPFSHQQYLHDFLDGLSKSFEAYNHAPYAHQIVSLTTAFVLGRGVSFKAKDDTVQERFAKWWHKCDMDDRLEVWSDMLSRDGELHVRRFINPIDKEIFLRWVGPSTIWEIVTDIEDIETAYYYHQQYPAAYQVLYGAPAGAKYDPNKFDSTKYIINQIPADEMYSIKINVGPDEKRGRSDLFSILGWLKRHKDFQTGAVLKAIVQSVFAWKNKLKGVQTDVNSFIAAFGTDVPDFGSLWTENEASELTPMVADVKAGAEMAAPGIENTIAVGSGIPKEYLGASEHSSRSTAVVGSEPGIKKFQRRQLLLGRFLKRIAADWVKNEIAAGRVPAMQPGDDPDLSVVLRWCRGAMKRFPLIAAPLDQAVKYTSGQTLMIPTDTSIEFIFPEIAVEDRSKKMADLAVAKDEKAISHRRMAEGMAKELGIHEYNYDDEQDQIAEDTVNGLLPLYPTETLAPEVPGPGAAAQQAAPGPDQPKPSGGLSGQERSNVKAGDRR